MIIQQKPLYSTLRYTRKFSLYLLQIPRFADLTAALFSDINY